MSQELLTAFIGAVSTIFAALIGAFGAIAAAEKKKKSGDAGGGIGCGLVGLAAAFMGSIGLVLGVFFGSFIVQDIGKGVQQQSLSTQSTPPIVPTGIPATVFTPIPQGSQPIWQDLGVFYASDYVTLGDEQKWIVFQVWDGKDTSTTVHGVLEPGWFLRIPPPLQGTTWAVSGYSREYIVTRVMEMRDEVVQRDGIAVPPLVYVGANSTPPGYTSETPSGWIVQH